MEHQHCATTDELRADVFEYAKKLSEETGVPLDPEKVWANVRERMA